MATTKKPGLPSPVHRSKLYESLGFKSDRIPPTAAFRRIVTLYSNRLDREHYLATNQIVYPSLGEHEVIVRPATGVYAKHRIFVRCRCGSEVPAGRINQHLCEA